MKNKKIIALLILTSISSCGVSKQSFTFDEVIGSKASELYQYNKEVKLPNPGEDAFPIEHLMEGGFNNGEDDGTRFYTYRRKNITQNDKFYLAYVKEKRIDSILTSENIEETKREVFGGTVIDLNYKDFVDGKYLKMHKHLSNSNLDENVKFFEITKNQIDNVKFKDNGYILANVIRETSSLFLTNLSTKEQCDKTFTYLTPVKPFMFNNIKDVCVVEDSEHATITKFKALTDTYYDEEKNFLEADVINYENKDVIVLMRYISRGVNIDLLKKDYPPLSYEAQYDFYGKYKDILIDAFIKDVDCYAYFELNKLIPHMK